MILCGYVGAGFNNKRTPTTAGQTAGAANTSQAAKQTGPTTQPPAQSQQTVPATGKQTPASINANNGKSKKAEPKQTTAPVSQPKGKAESATGQTTTPATGELSSNQIPKPKVNHSPHH